PLDQLHFLAERPGRLARAAQARAQVRVELLENATCGIRLLGDEAMDVRDRIEEEMRLDLRLKQREARCRLGLQGLGRPTALALQFFPHAARMREVQKECPD